MPRSIPLPVPDLSALRPPTAASGSTPDAVRRPSRLRHRVLDVAELAPGLGLTAGVATIAFLVARIGWLQAHGIGALTLAIVLGIVVGNLSSPRVAASSDRGVTFSKQKLLRLGIVLYGLRVTFQDIGDVGLRGVAIDAVVLASTFALACWLGPRVFGLDRRTSMLIGAGSSICGAAAVMAAEPVVGGRAEHVTIAVSTVVVFGTLAIFVYPALFHLAAHQHLFALSEKAYGLYAGSTIHEVAQVVAAGRSIGAEAAGAAVIAKMVRVMMLAPFLLGLSAWLSRHPARNDGEATTDRGTMRCRIAIPWFALCFVAVAGVNSLAVLPRSLVTGATDVDTFVLAMAMAGLGLTTRATAIRTAGLGPLLLGTVLFAWLVVGGAAINVAVARIG